MYCGSLFMAPMGRLFGNFHPGCIRSLLLLRILIISNWAVILAEAAYGGPQENVSSSPSCRKLPITMPHTVLIDREKHVGLWYSLLSSEDNQQLNKVSNYSIIGKSYLPDSSIPTHIMRRELTYYMEDKTSPNQLRCTGQYFHMTARNDGTDYNHVYDPEVKDNPSFQMYNHLLDDPSSQGLEIYYRCAEFNTATGMCDKPMVYVNTRTHPNLFTSDERDRVNAQVDQVLSAHCISVSSLQKTVYKSELPTCSPTVPDAFVNLENGMKNSVPVRS